MSTGTGRRQFEIRPEPGTPAPPDFVVRGFEGTEELSGLYRFEVDLSCNDPDVDVAALVSRRATFSLSYDRTRKFHGVIEEMHQSGQPWAKTYEYRAVLVPAMARLGLSLQSQIYGTDAPVSVLDVVASELIGVDVKGTADLSSARIPAEFVDFGHLPRGHYQSNPFPRRDYIVQYLESDLAFVSRLLEHYGIFYYFGFSGDQEKVVLGDHNSAFDAVPSTMAAAPGEAATGATPPVLPYREPAGNVPLGECIVKTITRRRRRVAAKVVLRDYNYRRARLGSRNPEYMHADAEVDPDGHGIVVGYGDHFRDRVEGEALAKIRAEEIRCTRDVFSGESDCYTFAPGHTFDLRDHFCAAFNQRYLLVRVHHRHGRRFGDGKEDAAYANEFEAIPYATSYRPPRQTPKPVVHGLLNAHVDAGGIGSRAQIDSEGRYKIRIPFDLSGSGETHGSRYLRMAQPYAGFQSPDGEDTGMHFPLLKGTEVTIACINGDPDRPIIASTLPNPNSRTLVTGANQTKNQIRTQSGILMEFEDGRPGGNT